MQIKEVIEMARKKKVPVTPVTPQKTENQPTQTPSQNSQVPSGGQSSTPQVLSTPQKVQ